MTDGQFSFNLLLTKWSFILDFAAFYYSSLSWKINFVIAPLKIANITHVFFKIGDRNSNDNYKPVSILTNMSKTFERCIFYQFYNFMFEFLANNQHAFSKGYSMRQYFLLAMLEKWKFCS